MFCVSCFVLFEEFKRFHISGVPRFVFRLNEGLLELRILGKIDIYLAFKSPSGDLGGFFKL